MPSNDVLKEVLDKAHEAKPVKEIIALSPAALQGVTDKDAELLKQAFGIKTIQDMAENKFFRWAQALVTLAAVEK
jgi:hypothetical protein